MIPTKDISHDERVEREKTKNEKWLDAIRGCLIGGAAGDALGYPVEFLSADEIKARYSAAGITGYDVGRAGKALISDDTQMTLFTANGILHGATRQAIRGISGPVESYVYMAYLDWLTTQTGQKAKHSISWLIDVDELHAKRAPGMTCLAALESGKCGSIEKPINNSKGCGGVMRVAPVALYFKEYRKDVPMIGAEVAALTHGHPLGYMPAAALAYIISHVIYGSAESDNTLYGIVNGCMKVLRQLFDNEYLDELIDIMQMAVDLSKSDISDVQNITRLGQGWVAEEALAIALYCSLKYSDDFSKALITAVNHDGDSDSTGAITGNIVGAYVGYGNISKKWKNDLQIHDVILEIADDLCHECQMDGWGIYQDEVWESKYVKNKRFAVDG